jgi:hypothetical protein
MRKLLAMSLTALSVTVAFTPVASASVMTEGQAMNGFYWQLVAKKNGTIVWICRSIHDNRFQKHSSCEAAGAVKPAY